MTFLYLFSLYKLQKLLSVGGEIQLPLRTRTQDGAQQDDSEVGYTTLSCRPGLSFFVTQN